MEAEKPNKTVRIHYALLSRFLSSNSPTMIALLNRLITISIRSALPITVVAMTAIVLSATHGAVNHG